MERWGKKGRVGKEERGSGEDGKGGRKEGDGKRRRKRIRRKNWDKVGLEIEKCEKRE